MTTDNYLHQEKNTLKNIFQYFVALQRCIINFNLMINILKMSFFCTSNTFGKVGSTCNKFQICSNRFRIEKKTLCELRLMKRQNQSEQNLMGHFYQFEMILNCEKTWSDRRTQKGDFDWTSFWWTSFIVFLLKRSASVQ